MKIPGRTRPSPTTQPHGTTRIDRTYVSADIKPRQMAVDTRAAVFTDHFAVTLRLNIATPVPTRGNGYWKMYISLLEGKNFHNIMQSKWTQWCSHKKYYPTQGMWWTRYIKRMLKFTFIREGSMRRKDITSLENTYYAAKYSLSMLVHPNGTILPPLDIF
jgi:hypothetical protein